MGPEIEQVMTSSGLVLREIQSGCVVDLLIEPTPEWLAQNQPQLDPIIITEPVDEEKAAMAEAIIDLDARLTTLENKGA